MSDYEYRDGKEIGAIYFASDFNFSSSWNISSRKRAASRKSISLAAFCMAAFVVFIIFSRAGLDI